MPDTHSPINFGLADMTDASEIAALIERAYRGALAATSWTNEAAILEGPRSSLTEVEGLLRESDSRFATARDATGIVGSALIQRLGQGAYFGMFAIDPARQASGVGRALLAHAESTAQRLWGATFMRLTVISLRDELIGWYERRGYINTGFREPFPFETATGALRTDFDLIVLEKPL